MEERPNILKASLIAGALAGVLSGLPLVGVVNFCFCLWIILGGILSSYILTTGFPQPVKSGDHMISGLLTGVFAAIISFIISIPFMAVSAKFMERIFDTIFRAYGAEMPPGLEDALTGKGFSATFIPLYVAGLIINMVIYGLFGLIGGLIGGALFKKQIPPQQTQ